MPKGPLIQDPVKRRIAIAVVMAVLFLASMVGAWLITGASLGL